MKHKRSHTRPLALENMVVVAVVVGRRLVGLVELTLLLLVECEPEICLAIPKRQP